MRKNKKIVLLFILGLLILLYPHIAQFVNNYLQKNQVEDFLSGLEDLSEDEINKLMEQAQKCNKEIYYDLNGFRDPWGDHQEKLMAFNECLGFDDDEIFGAIEIPKLKLVIPIYLGSSEEVLSKGVGQVEGSSLPLGGKSTHTVLAGHRGMGTKAMFRNIDELNDGDVFYIHTMNETLTYKVLSQEIIYPHETESLEIVKGKDMATLLTCHPYRHNYQRLLIHGERYE